jgi:CTP synthase (UTP-ammonia lyase)
MPQKEHIEKIGRIALIGDYNAGVVAHQAIPKALDRAIAELKCASQYVWLHTSAILNAPAQLADFDGVWCVPASPFANTAGALAAIRYAREQDLPYLGTCAGFQHALIEYARNVCFLAAADHAETAPETDVAVIHQLSCSLVDITQELTLFPGSVIRSAYGSDKVSEEYHCRYGFNSHFASTLFNGELWPTAVDSQGEVRAVEIRSKPFFVATLFQPERRVLRGETPLLVKAFVKAVSEHKFTASRPHGDIRSIGD